MLACTIEHWPSRSRTVCCGFGSVRTPSTTSWPEPGRRPIAPCPRLSLTVPLRSGNAVTHAATRHGQNATVSLHFVAGRSTERRRFHHLKSRGGFPHAGSIPVPGTAKNQLLAEGEPRGVSAQRAHFARNFARDGFGVAATALTAAHPTYRNPFVPARRLTGVESPFAALCRGRRCGAADASLKRRGEGAVASGFRCRNDGCRLRATGSAS